MEPIRQKITEKIGYPTSKSGKMEMRTRKETIYGMDGKY